MEQAGSTGQTQKPENTRASEHLSIPKHRFDCVNLAYKETKQALNDKAAELDVSRARIAGLEAALLDAKAETALARHGAKSLTAAKALIDFSELRLEQDGKVPGLEEQVLRIKKSQPYLFGHQAEAAYILLPVDTGEPLHKSITNYANKSNRRTDK